MTHNEWLQNLVKRGEAAAALKADQIFLGLMTYVDDYWKSVWLNATTVEERERLHSRMTGLRDILEDILPALIADGENAAAELNGAPIQNYDEEEINAP